MKKSNLNFVIDFVLFILLALLIGIGLLVKYVLISGAESWEKYGENYEFNWLGLERHQWGTVHLIVGIVFFALIALHIILHWNTIVCLYKRFVKVSLSRVLIGILSLIMFLVLAFFAFIINPDKEKHGKGRERVLKLNNESGKIIPGESDKDTKMSLKNSEMQNVEHTDDHQHEHNISGIEVKGYMTLNEVAEKYDVSVKYLKDGLGFPASVAGNERLGQLKKKYNFTMSEVEHLIVDSKR